MNVESKDSPIFPWRDAYSLGIPEIDAQHKILVRLINNLQEAMMDGRGKAVLSGIVDELARYTQTHFAFEEAWLKKRGYSQTAGHAAEHVKLAEQVQDLSQRIQTGRLSITMDVMRFLKGWLTRHILGSDHAYARELNGKAPRLAP